MSKSSLTENDEYRREYEAILQRERLAEDFFASTVEIEEETPMLIEGLVSENGVSVFYGAYDEFKTTVVLDMMAHVAAGANWQGRKVKARPVIWYALEGKEEIPVRLRALESSLKSSNTPWGDHPLPIIARDRIPESHDEWRTEICKIHHRIWLYCIARLHTGGLVVDPENCNFPLYPLPGGGSPIIVIDTLSLALAGEDEKGPRAAGFIAGCLDLLKDRPDLGNPFDFVVERKQYDEWDDQNLDNLGVESAVASHVIIIHHQTKTGVEIAGHRAIGADTQALYRVQRFGKMKDINRSYSGQVIPERVKGITRPAPIHFEVEIVPVEGTARTAAILKDKAKAIPEKLMPVILALQGSVTDGEINKADLNTIIDQGADASANSSALRAARKRSIDSLISSGILEPIESYNSQAKKYRFNDPGHV